MLKTMAILIAFPWLAFPIAALFGGLYFAYRLTVLGAAVAAWLLYGVYEYLMYFRILCGGECNIRVDLLLIYSALVLLSAVAVIRVLLSRRNSNAPSES